MQKVKKTAEYTVLKRGDGRYAVKDSNQKPINGDAKTEILRREGLLKTPTPKAPEEPQAEGEAAAE